ncbi:hypothetical protein BN946_scf184966.g2 [Trametes cinnabarina]|uniref:Uncharacterized protein n=1 Tax=Pycnoporus cinnabarinus TaxID=5643 RepID=A0A060ST20_PYCCI|nr:hypothetical protein BN946_scf184966.g2 [Trametes cinnabarina]
MSSSSSEALSGILGDSEDSVSVSESSGSSTPLEFSSQWMDGAELRVPEALQNFLDMSSPIPVVISVCQDPRSPLTPTRLKLHGPQNSSQALLHSYFQYQPPAPPINSPGSEEILLDETTSKTVYLAFRKFVKTASSSCVQSSSHRIHTDTVRVAYLNVVQAMAGLRDSLYAIPLADVSWLQDDWVSSRLPGLLGACEDMEGDGDVDDGLQLNIGDPGTLCSRRVQATPSRANAFHLRPFDLGEATTELVVPTSCPSEVEYPYLLVPSLETMLAAQFAHAGTTCVAVSRVPSPSLAVNLPRL